MAYDAKHGEYVLFGGQTPTHSSDETWTSDGKTWKLQTPAHRPATREGAAMAYDRAHGVIVMYGGTNLSVGEGQDLADTWTWDGIDWTQADAGPGAPGMRNGPSMVSTPNGVLLFGGHFANVDYYADVWSWTGKVWQRVDAAPRPPGRAGAAVAWIPTDSSLFAFGGIGIKVGGGPGESGVTIGDGWRWDRRTWSKLPGSGPGATSFADAIWDATSASVVVLLGMTCPDPTDTAWAWAAGGWSRLPNPGMSARWGAAVAQAPGGEALLFGGSNQRGC
jgi:hypothetical protein